MIIRLLISLIALQTVQASQARIIGGNVARSGRWPFIVSLNQYIPGLKKYRHHCGGSILNRYQILTAAHCFDKNSNPLDWVALVGKNNIKSPIHKPKISRLTRKKAKKMSHVFIPQDILIHEKYQSKGWVNDIAIINLKNPLPLNRNTMKKIALARKKPVKSDQCYVGGWGSLHRNGTRYPEKLREAEVPIRDFRLCRKNYIAAGSRNVKPGQNFCAGNGLRDSCSVRNIQ